MFRNSAFTYVFVLLASGLTAQSGPQALLPASVPLASALPRANGADEARLAEGITDSIGQFKHIVFPVLYYTPETSWAFGMSGLKLFPKDEKDSLTYTSYGNAVVVYTLEDQFKLESNLLYYSKGNKWNWVTNFEFLHYPIDFYGIGNISLSTNKEKISYKRFTLNNKLYRKIKDQLFIGLQNQNKILWDIDFLEEGIFNDQITNGRHSGRAHGLGLILRLDKRDNNLCPQSGYYFNIGYTFYATYMINDPELNIGLRDYFYNIKTDYRKYFKLPYRIINAWQFYGDMNFGEVPFFKMASIGSSRRMRGYYGGILINNHLMMLQTDFRIPVYKKFGGVVFGGIASVSPNLSISTIEWHPNYGIGLRYMLDPVKKFNIRLDWGFGPGIQGVYITASEAF